MFFNIYAKFSPDLVDSKGNILKEAHGPRIFAVVLLAPTPPPPLRRQLSNERTTGEERVRDRYGTCTFPARLTNRRRGLGMEPNMTRGTASAALFPSLLYAVLYIMELILSDPFPLHLPPNPEIF